MSSAKLVEEEEMKIIPSYNTILISPEKIDDVVKGTFIEAVVTGKNQPEVGRVIAIGKFCPRWKGEDNPLETYHLGKFRPNEPGPKGMEQGKITDDIHKGDVVAYRRYGESKFFLKTKEYMFISFDDVLGVIRLEKTDEPKNC